MAYLQAGLATLAALAFIAASAAMNYVFLSSLGKSGLEGQIFGSISVAADLTKALIPLFIATAWAAGRRIYVVIGSIAFCILFVFSSVSAIGFAAGNRGAVTGSKQEIAARYQAAAKEQAELERRAGSLAARPGAVIAEALSALEQDRRWTSSKRCTEATAQDSRAFCEGYFSTKAELAAALERKRLEERLGQVQGELRSLAAAGGREDSDAQATLLSRLTGWNVPATQMALAIFVAMIVEFGAALGLYLAWGWLPDRRVRPAPAAALATAEVVAPTPAPRRRVIAASSAEPAAATGGASGEIEDAEYWNGPPRRLRLVEQIG